MSDDPAEIREEMAQTRERMGQTVDALADKADVRSQTQDKINQKKERLNRKKAELVDRVRGTLPKDRVQARDQLTGTVKRASSIAKDKPGWVGGAFLAALLVAVGSIYVARRPQPSAQPSPARTGQNRSRPRRAGNTGAGKRDAQHQQRVVDLESIKAQALAARALATQVWARAEARRQQLLSHR